ncbi:GrpB family protein [Rhodopseudomonas sp. G2_2311]|uniref:GrpB family protein n=1 Tax=Rhodopseudomonas sp. G2_2311 TaxID=3114287 RepID=UPI0039C6D136
MFAAVKQQLIAVLPNTSELLHIGATSVPGCLTKGDLDIVIRVERGRLPRHGRRARRPVRAQFRLGADQRIRRLRRRRLHAPSRHPAHRQGRRVRRFSPVRRCATRRSGSGRTLQ